jgi:predicted enzyme related to lactoylglutathione lyase
MNKINYLEIPAKDLKLTKKFFTQAFEWEFIDYGEEYSAFTNAGIDGGFYQADLTVSTKNGSPLIVLLSQDLQLTQEKIIAAKGKIIKDIFSFPGGERFHFTDPSGNEYAVWSMIDE